MPTAFSKLRAIDLYSGVGGWSLGLSLAGIEVVASYERWAPANETNFKNNHHQAHTVDIRGLSVADLPAHVDVVVGSPPCTQFSYSNRGGSGDVADGLADIQKFFEIVDFLRPTFWVMENVPRVARIVVDEMQNGGCLARFRHLNVDSTVVNMEDFGVPQRRRRCLIGNINFDLLRDYASTTPKRTMGSIVHALTGSGEVVDPLYGVTINRSELRDHCVEDFFNEEEERINRAAKRTHPVYNRMPFPDPLNRSVRTITATCTRVSRESIVIEDPVSRGRYRRLTVRERACLQGFPVTYQFYADGHGQKTRMVGNALPPPFAYLVGHALRGTPSHALPSLVQASTEVRAPVPLASERRPDRAGATFREDRSFRFAIPSLWFASGVRFELANSTIGGRTSWSVAFVFGPRTS
jgi:DNA (cytosine-5)-methyltransferase 1